MKRSEMIKLMVEVAKYYDGSYLEPYAAEKLLSSMEEAGMLPPIAHYHEQDRELKQVWNEVKKRFYWEPEDD